MKIQDPVSVLIAVTMLGHLVSSTVLAESKVKPAKEGAKDHALVLGSGFEITVILYDPDAQVFQFSMKAQPGVGPNYATPENLQKAIGLSGSTEDFVRKMKNEPGSVYVTRKPLPLMGELEKRERAKKFK